ncbi:PQQ-binding-like beta-propeller repeat protein [Microbaculum marinisediminis]|uniref:PQQ-binding-like beta-propeller repeat protein n=1 Tax=Microbaculum marinisediminis TaxID=2931392 RepID=A0AAW5QYR2_9HYPH|nr:PQQ-binding-like beta-propeller repeat protein [Microbaculum sp. A6E488]MCT8973196.1 PQQ-binding-like beta-propeller repeat protein [Microbaculum sp. A6E488]
MAVFRTRSARILPAVLMVGAFALSACDSAPSLEDLSLVANPFAEKEKRLPGERRAVIQSTDGLVIDESAAAAPVSLPAAKDIGDWSQPGGNAANAPGNVAVGSGGSTWAASVAKVDRKGRLSSRPIVYRGLVIVMDQKASVSAYSLNGGGRGWTVSLRPEKEDSPSFNGGVAAEGGFVIAATGYGTVAGISANDGGILWSVELGAPARSAPTIANGKAYVVSSDNIVYAIAIDTGETVWTYSGIGSSAGVLGNASPAVVGNQVIVPYSSGEILSFDTENGEPKWLDALTGASRFTAVSGLTDVAASPVVYEGSVYAVSVSGRMIGVSVKDGNRLWAQNVASAHTPAVAGNAIFATTLGGTVVALDRKNGAVRWISDLTPETGDKKKKKNDVFSLAGPLLAGGQLWVGTSDGRIITLDPSSGSVVSAQTVGSPVYVNPIAAGGRILVLDNSGKLTAYN